jgi:hypothetical protein
MCHIPIEPQNTVDYLDIAFKLAAICIALFNVIFAINIFRIKNKKDDSEKEKDIKIQLLKTLVLDHNLKYFYSVFDEIESELLKLKAPNLNDNQKSKIDSDIADLFIKLRRRFFDSLLAIDDDLYDVVIDFSDELQGHLTNSIFDQGVNLSHAPKFDELIKEKIIKTKTEIIRKLFNYRGD